MLDGRSSLGGKVMRPSTLILLALLIGSAVLVALSPGLANASSPPTTSSVTVTSQDASGDTIAGFRTVLYASNETMLAKGFTPNSFTTTVGDAYGVLADSYGGCTFTKWSDGVTSDPRSYVAVNSAAVLSAVYDCERPTASNVTVDSVNQNGVRITGFRTVFYASKGSMIAKGFTPGTFSTMVGQTYGVLADSYGGCTFVEWSDGVTNDPRSFTATSAPVSYTAVYYCGEVSPTPAVVQSCTAHQPEVQTITCTMGNVRAGDMLVVQLDEVSIASFTDSMGDSFTLLTVQQLPTSTYDLYVYYAIAVSTGPDTFTLSGNGNYASILATELQGVQFASAYYSDSGTSAMPTIASYTPPTGSLNMAFLIGYGNGETVSAGAGYTLVSQTNFSAVEYAIVTGTTSPSFSLSASNPWVEVAAVFV